MTRRRYSDGNARYKLVGRAARYEAELLSGALFPGPEGWPIEQPSKPTKPKIPTIHIEPASPYIQVSSSLLVKRGSGKEKLREEGCCRMCRRLAAELDDLADTPGAIRIMTRHHLVPQRWYRQNLEWRHLRECDANIVPLCNVCHCLVELSDKRGGLPHRKMLRKVMTQDEIVFVIQVRGREWLDRRYPD